MLWFKQLLTDLNAALTYSEQTVVIKPAKAGDYAPWFTAAFGRYFQQLLRKVAVSLCESFKLYLWNFFLNNSTNPFRHGGMGTKNFLIVLNALSKRNWEIKKHQLLETSIERFHTREHVHPCKLIRTEESSSCSAIIRVRVVLKRTVIGYWYYRRKCSLLRSRY